MALDSNDNRECVKSVVKTGCSGNMRGGGTGVKWEQGRLAKTYARRGHRCGIAG